MKVFSTNRIFFQRWMMFGTFLLRIFVHRIDHTVFHENFTFGHFFSSEIAIIYELVFDTHHLVVCLMNFLRNLRSIFTPISSNRFSAARISLRVFVTCSFILICSFSMTTFGDYSSAMRSKQKTLCVSFHVFGLFLRV